MIIVTQKFKVDKKRRSELAALSEEDSEDEIASISLFITASLLSIIYNVIKLVYLHCRDAKKPKDYSAEIDIIEQEKEEQEKQEAIEEELEKRGFKPIGKPNECRNQAPAGSEQAHTGEFSI